ncbi:MAG: hypothetical protein EAZ74_00315 [Alphaproteobacteria bacterium]|nr:MAG: hypothetical protein EAY76_02785 [Alphaproteobacteria bacterium]TAF15994.1 MAG: hypothetical protein EAZ74_00315 [Alphaproteobacteria bacterium]TAF39256.1 MAG: hypothetical protein EAZ66_05070 [Alphaproteobacteria bacterium]TAF76234.1 MAG: hypothetical protein EAZ52_04875 [Alphaproteobacteria bacterium]
MNNTAPLENKKEESSEEGLSGFTKNASVLLRVPEAVIPAMQLGGANFISAAAGAIPVIGDGAKTVASATNSGVLQGAVEGMTQISGVDRILAGVTAGSHLLSAADELKEGDHVGATGKVARAAVEAGGVLLSVTGPIGIAAELATKVTTGKFITTHLGDFAEGTTTTLLGGTKEERETQQQQPQVTASTPATSAVVPTGIAASGLTSTNVTMVDGQKLSVGTLPGNRTPDGKEVGAIALDSPPVIPKQVMDATYAPAREIVTEQPQMITEPAPPTAIPAQGRDENFWRDKIAAEKAGRVAEQQQGQNNITPTNNPLFADAVTRAEQMMANRAQSQQGDLTHTR